MALGLRRSCPGSFACLQMDLQRIFLSTLMVSVFIIAGGADWQDYLNVARRRAKSPGFTAPPYYTRRKGKYKNMLIENNSILDCSLDCIHMSTKDESIVEIAQMLCGNLGAPVWQIQDCPIWVWPAVPDSDLLRPNAAISQIPSTLRRPYLDNSTEPNQQRGLKPAKGLKYVSTTSLVSTILCGS